MRLPSSGTLLRSFGELLLGLAVAAVTSLVLQWVINRLPMPRPSNLPSVVIAIAGAAAIAALVAAAVARRWRTWFTPLAWCALATVGTAPLSAVLNGTKYYLGGLSFDQTFRIEYLTRLTDSPGLADFNYRDIPPYYPAGWFWIGGRFANLVDMPAWAAFKPFAILTVSVVGVVVFTLWRLSVSRRIALALSAVTVLFALPTSALEPYSWLVAATIPPFALLAWRLLHTVALGCGREALPTTVVLGAWLGVCGCLYTLYFFFAGFVLVMLGLVCLLRQTGQSGVSRFQALRRITPHAVLIVVLAGAIMCFVWAPYLLGLARGMRGPNAAASFLLPNSAQLPTPFLAFTVIGVLCLVGLFWLLATVRRGGRFADAATVLATMVVACYLWYLLSQLALLVGTTLLAFRIEPVLVIVLICAAVLAVVELFGWALPRVAAQWRWPLRASAAILAVTALVGPLQDLPRAAQTEIGYAFTDYYPTGHTSSGEADPAAEGYWIPALNNTISQLTARPPDQNVVLSLTMLPATTPYWSFQAQTPHYANPLAEYDQRRALISSWARAANSAELAAELKQSPFAPPSVFVFHRTDQGLSIDLSRDVFPRDPNVDYYKVPFARTLFDGPQFQVRDVGPFTVVAVR